MGVEEVPTVGAEEAMFLAAVRHSDELDGLQFHVRAAEATRGVTGAHIVLRLFWLCT